LLPFSFYLKPVIFFCYLQPAAFFLLPASFFLLSAACQLLAAIPPATCQSADCYLLLCYLL
jgi:hypothetical protein